MAVQTLSAAADHLPVSAGLTLLGLEPVALNVFSS